MNPSCLVLVVVPIGDDQDDGYILDGIVDEGIVDDGIVDGVVQAVRQRTANKPLKLRDFFLLRLLSLQIRFCPPSRARVLSLAGDEIQTVLLASLEAIEKDERKFKVALQAQKGRQESAKAAERERGRERTERSKSSAFSLFALDSPAAETLDELVASSLCSTAY